MRLTAKANKPAEVARVGRATTPARRRFPRPAAAETVLELQRRSGNRAARAMVRAASPGSVAQRRATGKRGVVPPGIHAQPSHMTAGFTANHAANAITPLQAFTVFNNRNVPISTVVQMTDAQAEAEVVDGFANRGKAAAQPAVGGAANVGNPFPTENTYNYIFYDSNHDFLQRGTGILKVATHYSPPPAGLQLGHMHAIGKRSNTQQGTAHKNLAGQVTSFTFP